MKSSESSTACERLRSFIHAAPGQPGREGRGWYPLWQLEEELDPATRRRYQVVEVLHFMCGEIIPRRASVPGGRVSTRSWCLRYLPWPRRQYVDGRAPQRAIAAREVQHLNHLVPLSSSRVES